MIQRDVVHLIMRKTVVIYCVSSFWRGELLKHLLNCNLFILNTGAQSVLRSFSSYGSTVKLLLRIFLLVKSECCLLLHLHLLEKLSMYLCWFISIFQVGRTLHYQIPLTNCLQMMLSIANADWFVKD